MVLLVGVYPVAIQEINALAPRSGVVQSYLSEEEIQSGIFVPEPPVEVFPSEPVVEWIVPEEPRVVSQDWKSELRKILESPDPDSPEFGSVVFQNVPVNPSGRILFSFTGPGENKSKKMKFDTNFDPGKGITITRIRVKNPKYPGKPYSIFKLEGEVKGKKVVAYYDLPRKEDGSFDFSKNKIGFQLLKQTRKSDHRFYLRWLLESGDLDQEVGGKIQLGEIRPDQRGNIVIHFISQGEKKSRIAVFGGTGFDPEKGVSITRIRVKNPKFPEKPYFIFMLEGEAKGERVVRYYDFPRKEDGSPDFLKSIVSFQLLNKNRISDQRFYLKWLLENGDIDKEIGGEIQLRDIMPSQSGYIPFSFTPKGETKSKSVVFAQTGFDPEKGGHITRLRVKNPKYPGKPYYIFKLEGEAEGEKVVRYYDLPRKEDGSLNFSKRVVSFQLLNEYGVDDQRFYLRWLLESDNSDNEIGDEFQLTGIKPNRWGDISFSFMRSGKKKPQVARFRLTDVIGEVSMHCYYSSQKGYRLFVLEGQMATGDRYERVYRLKRGSDGKPNFKGNCFRLVSIRWLGNVHYNRALTQAREMIEAVADAYQIEDIDQFCARYPQLVKQILQEVANEPEFKIANPQELEGYFWRMLLHSRLHEKGWSADSKKKAVDSDGTPSPRSTFSATTQSSLERISFGEEEWYYQRYREDLLQEGRNFRDVIASLRQALSSIPAQERARNRLLDELNQLQQVQEEISRRGILQPGVQLEMHQLEAIRKMRKRGSIILGDDVGLGKTLQVLVGMATCGAKKAVIVGPKTGLGVYLRELREKLRIPVEVHILTSEENLQVDTRPREGMQVHLVTEEKEDFLQKWLETPKKQNNLQILLTNYEQLVSREIDPDSVSAKSRPDVLVVDEAQRVKNEEALRTEATYRIPRNNTALLTATIVDNAARDLRLPLLRLWQGLSEEANRLSSWRALATVAPYLESDEAFNKMLDPGGSESVETESRRVQFLEALQRVMQEVMVRRRAEMVLQSKLPQKQEEQVRLSLERGEMIYGGEKIRLGSAEEYAPQKELYMKISSDGTISPLARKNYLRQVLSDPALLVRERERGTEDLAHFPRVREYVRELEEKYGKQIGDWRSIKKDAVRAIIEKETNKRVTLFSRYVGVTEEQARESGWSGLASSLNGNEVTLQQRENTIRDFKKGKVTRLASTYGVGGLAVDFTSNSPQGEEILLIESWPEKGSELRQAIGRQYRRAADNRNRRGENLRVLELIVEDVGSELMSVDERDRLICAYKDLISLLLENGATIWSIFPEMRQIESELDRRLFPEPESEQDESEENEVLEDEMESLHRADRLTATAA